MYNSPMSWGKEAFSRRGEAQRQAEDQERARRLAEEKAQIEKENLIRNIEAQSVIDRQNAEKELKNILEQRGAQSLLEDLKAAAGGTLIFRSGSRRVSQYGTLELGLYAWASYGLVHAQVGNPERYVSGDYEWQEEGRSYQSLSDIEMGTGGSYVPGSKHYMPLSKGASTPIEGFRIIIRALRDKSYGKDKSFIETQANNLQASIGTPDWVPHNRLSSLFRNVPSIPGLRGPTTLHSSYGWKFSDILPDGRINPDAINIDPGESFLNHLTITEDLIRDHEGIKQALESSIRNMK
jgi:hypothetical protein